VFTNFSRTHVALHSSPTRRSSDILMRLVKRFRRSDVGFAVSENLFKLVDEKTDVLGGILLDHAHQFGESVLAAAQYGVRDRDVDGAFVGLQITFADHVIDRCFGEVKDRRDAGPDRDYVPFGSGLGYESPIQNRKETGEHERRLTTAGVTENCEEAATRELEEDLIHLPFAAEEEVALVGRIRT